MDLDIHGHGEGARPAARIRHITNMLQMVLHKCRWLFSLPGTHNEYKGGALYSEIIAMQVKIFHRHTSRQNFTEVILQPHDLYSIITID